MLEEAAPIYGEMILEMYQWLSWVYSGTLSNLTHMVRTRGGVVVEITSPSKLAGQMLP